LTIAKASALYVANCHLDHVPIKMDHSIIQQWVADASCTPGAVFEGVTIKDVCMAGWAEAHRNVSQSTRQKVYARYGINYVPGSGDYEVDHLIPLELGGNNSVENLWPEPSKPYGPGTAGDKDETENALHAAVCAGRWKLQQAWRLLRVGWTR
jgi:hypothetical protein